jgi:hypothetical protein
MCNIYRMTRADDEVARLFGATPDRVPILLILLLAYSSGHL